MVSRDIKRILQMIQLCMANLINVHAIFRAFSVLGNRNSFESEGVIRGLTKREALLVNKGVVEGKSRPITEVTTTV